MPSCTAPRPSPSPCPPTHHPVQAISLREAVAAQGRPRAEAGEGGGLARPGARPAPALAGAARARAAGGRDRGRAAGTRAALRPGGQGDGDDRQGAGLRRVRHPRGGRVGAARRDRDLGAGSALVAVRAPGLACRGGEGRGGEGPRALAGSALLPGADPPIARVQGAASHLPGLYAPGCHQSRRCAAYGESSTPAG